MIRLFTITLLALLSACSLQSTNDDTTRPPRVRQPKDTIGFTHSAEGISKVVAQAMKAEEANMAANRARLEFTDRTCLSAAISPHDDYVYAQQVYIHLYPYLKADHVILIGVAHRARDFPSCEGKLVFEAFDAWHGPYGNVSIVPVLVPYMSFDRLSDLSDKTAGVLGGILAKRGLALGKDVALLISADCVHYGDRDWGGKSYADFGTDGAGYDQGVARDLSLVSDCLTGEISVEGLGNFYGRLVADDFHEYKITWCGRFSIPFGLALLIRLADRLDTPAPRGALLRYGTTLDPGRSDPDVPGLGVTARANLHHWVGFTAIAYP